MRHSFKIMVGYANICLAFVCLLFWLLNFLGYIGVGDPVGQIIMVPVCTVLGTMLLRPGTKTI
jgi:ascorbate-specific PTS system EIIC-type component UlaA